MTEPETPATEEAPKKKMTPGAIMLLIVLLIGVPFGGLALVWKNRCQKSVLTDIEAPSGEFAAEQVLTNCGPTMRIASEVRLIRLGVPGGEEKTVLLLPAKDPLPMRWTDEHTFEITVPPEAEIASRVLEWQGMKIVLAGGPLKAPHPGMPVPKLNP